MPRCKGVNLAQCGLLGVPGNQDANGIPLQRGGIALKGAFLVLEFSSMLWIYDLMTDGFLKEDLWHGEAHGSKAA